MGKLLCFVLAMVLSAFPACADVPAGVTATLEAMQKAVLAGDEAAYMSLVVSGDAAFRVEQANWADDWVKNRVESYELSLVPVEAQAGVEPAGATRFLGTLTTNWKLPAWSKARSVSFDVFFSQEKGGAWLYGGEVWTVVDKPATETFAGCRVKFDASNPVMAKTASIAAAALPAIRAHVDSFFETKVGTVQEVKLYGTVRHLQHSIWLSYTDSLGGWNEPNEAIKALVTPQSAKKISAYLAHEYGHVVSFTLGPKATDAAWWMLEGCADLASEAYRENAVQARRRTVSAWALKDELAPWEAITPFPLKPEHAKFSRHVYTQGEHMLAWQTEQFGAHARNAFITRLCEGKTLDEAARSAFGKTWKEIDEGWRAAVSVMARDQRPDAADEP